MMANLSAHRRANAFAQALEDQIPEGRTAEHPADAAADGQRTLLALASGLGELPKPELDPEVKAVQRAQLVAAMERMFADGTEPRSEKAPRQRHRKSAPRAGLRSGLTKGLAASGLSMSVAAGALGGVAAASSGALPGDSLYPVKRGVEDLKVDLANDDSTRGELYLQQASTRLNEVRRLLERSRSGSLDYESQREIRQALSGMQDEISEGHRLLSAAYERDGSVGPIQALASFSEAHHRIWNKLRDRLPAQLADVSEQVTSTLQAVEEDLSTLMALLPSTPGGGDRPGGYHSFGPSGSGDQSTASTAPSGSSSEGRNGKGALHPSETKAGEPDLTPGDAGDLSDSPMRGSGTAKQDGDHETKRSQPESTASSTGAPDTEGDG